MENVDLPYAKEHLEELLARAARGEEVVIEAASIGRVRLTSVGNAPAQPIRYPGRWRGRLGVPDDAFLMPMTDEELRLWYGDDD